VTAAFVEVADGVHILRYPVLDVNVTLVTGDGAALLVDTLSTAAQAGELLAAVRAVTAHRCTVVNTHHHFDHCFGNATLAGAGHGPFWAHEEAATLLREQGGRLRRRWYDEWVQSQPDLARDLARAEVLAPTRTVHLASTVEVGGRRVVLRHLGRGHTAGDLTVHVPDAGVVVAGDLVEQGAPPSFEDAYPLEWPEALAELLRVRPTPRVVVPGHGAPVDLAFVAAQHAELTSLAWLIRDGHADAAPVAAVAARAPFGPQVALTAVRRGYAELDGAL
jgi:glyoxylase-like metal-dependent hydrolase (beta-lactamase superfamily II)